MKLEITAKNNYHVSDRLHEILSAKLKRLDKYFPDDSTPCKVVLSDLGRQCKMEISINFRGTYIRSEVIGDTMYYNIDSCLPKLERQLVKMRGKISKSQKLPDPSEFEFVSDVDLEPVKIAKTKRFEISRQSALEAADHMDMSGHDFYLFVNEETGNVEAVYRRKDGSIGLLQPYEN